MNAAQPLDRSEKLKGLVAALALVLVAVGFGYFTGNWITSADWQAAVRIAVMGGMVAIMLINPLDGLLLWIVIAPFGQATWTEIWRILNFRMAAGIPDITPDRLAAAALAVLYIAQLGVGRRRVRRLNVELWMVTFCILAMPAALSSLTGIYQAGQTLLDKFVIPFLVFGLAKNLYKDEGSLKKLVGTLAAVGIYVSLMVFYEHLTGQPLFVGIGRTTVYSRSLRKIVSLLGNPAFLGTVLAMIVPVALYRYVRERSFYRRAFFAAIALLCFLGNFFCYNRGAWLALAAALVVMLIDERYRRFLLPILMVGGLLALAYWQVVSTTAVVSERLSNVSSIRFRLDLLAVSRMLIQDHPVFGVGMGNFSYYFLEYGGHWETLAFDLPTPHNTFVLVLSTMGLAAFVPFALIFLTMFSRLFKALMLPRRLNLDRALLVSGLGVLAVYVVSAAAVDLYVSVFTSLVFYLIMGMILGYLGVATGKSKRRIQGQAVPQVESRSGARVPGRPSRTKR